MVTEKTVSDHAAAAKMIRTELKAKYPETKFSVKAKSYAGGSSVDVCWTDGPKSAEVNDMIRKYQRGHFDGMTDMYEYSNSREDIPQVQFTFANREISDETREIIKEKIGTMFGVDMNDTLAVFEIFRLYPDEVISREFNTGFYSG